MAVTRLALAYPRQSGQVHRRLELGWELGLVLGELGLGSDSGWGLSGQCCPAQMAGVGRRGRLAVTDVPGPVAVAVGAAGIVVAALALVALAAAAAVAAAVGVTGDLHLSEARMVTCGSHRTLKNYQEESGHRTYVTKRS